MTTTSYAALVGIDWADQQHDVCLLADGQCEHRRVPQRAEDLEAWAGELHQRFGGRLVAVCLEQSRGALIYALLKYDFLVLFPINPKHVRGIERLWLPAAPRMIPRMQGYCVSSSRSIPNSCGRGGPTTQQLARCAYYPRTAAAGWMSALPWETSCVNG